MTEYLSQGVYSIEHMQRRLLCGYVTVKNREMRIHYIRNAVIIPEQLHYLRTVNFNDNPFEKLSMFVCTQLVYYHKLLTLKNAKYIFRVEGDNNKAKYGVTLGIYNRCVKEPTRRTFAVNKVVINPNFTSPTGNYDIAIITLNQTTDYTPICLPEEGKGRCATRLC